MRNVLKAKSLRQGIFNARNLKVNEKAVQTAFVNIENTG